MKQTLMSAVLTLVIVTVAPFYALAEGTIEGPATVDPLQIKWFGTRGFPGEDTPIQVMLESLLEKKLGYPVRFELTGALNQSDTGKVILLMLSANELPDIFSQDQEMAKPGFLEQAATPFSLAEYRLHMPRHAKRVTELIHQLAKDEETVFAKWQNDGGMMWGAPTFWEWGWIPSGQMWRLDKVEALGYDIPTTLAEAEDVFAAYKEAHPDEYALTGRGKTNWQCFDLVFNAFGLHGVMYAKRNGKVMHSFAAPEFREALVILRRWYEKGYWDPDFLNHGIEWITNFAEGKYLVTQWVKDWNFYTGEDTRYLNNLRDNVPGAMAVAARHLAADENTKPLQLVFEPFNLGVTVFGKHLESDTDKLHKLMAVGDLISMDREVNYLVSDGIEGIHYELDEDGLPKALPLVAGMGQQEVTEKYGFGYYWNGVFSSSRPLPRAMREMYQKFVFDEGAIYSMDSIEYAFPLPSNGAVYDEAGTPVQTQTQGGWFEMTVEIMTGVKPLEYFDEWLAFYYDHGGHEFEKHATRLYENHLRSTGGR